MKLFIFHPVSCTLALCPYLLLSPFSPLLASYTSVFHNIKHLFQPSDCNSSFCFFNLKPWQHSQSTGPNSKEGETVSVLWNLWKAPQRRQTKTSTQKATSVGESQRDAAGRDGLRGSMWGGFRNFSPHFIDRINFGINNRQIQGDQTTTLQNRMNIK